MQPFQTFIQQAKARAVNSEALRTAQEIQSLLDELYALAGVNRATDLMREAGYNVEPDQTARRRIEADAVHS